MEDFDLGQAYWDDMEYYEDIFNKLDNFIHTDKDGKVVDVRKIDDRYVSNLLPWYNKFLERVESRLRLYGYNIATNYVDNTKQNNKGYLYLKGRFNGLQ